MPAARALVPPDLQGLRQQQIQLLSSLLGLGAPAQNIPGSVQFRDRNALFSMPGHAAQWAQKNGTPAQGGNPGDALTQLLGSLSPFSAGKQGANGMGVSQFMNQPSPEQRAMDVAMPGLQEILNGGGPQFERDLSVANSQGGRFGSANAILRGEAFRHLTNNRTQAAQTLGLLSQGAGAGQQRQVDFADMDIQRRIQILMHLLGVAQQSTLGLPVVANDKAGFGDFLKTLVGAGTALSGLGGGLGGLLGGMGGGGIPAGIDTSGIDIKVPTVKP